MSVQLLNADSLPRPHGYSHVSIAPRGRLVHLAGQSGSNAQGEIRGGLAEQTENAFINLVSALEAANCGPQHLVKVTILVVGWSESLVSELVAGMVAANERCPLPPVPSTLHGVQSLFYDSMLVEIEGVAVLPDES